MMPRCLDSVVGRNRVAALHFAFDAASDVFLYRVLPLFLNGTQRKFAISKVGKHLNVRVLQLFVALGKCKVAVLHFL